MDNLKYFIENAGVALMMSIFGGIAKTALQGWKSWKQFLANLFVSGFAGFVVFLFIQDADFSPSMAAALTGMSGFSGVAVLEGLTVVTLKILEKITGQTFLVKWDGRERRTAHARGEKEKDHV